MVDQRIDGGPCPRLVPPKDWPDAASGAGAPWEDYLMEEVDGPDYRWEKEVYGPDYCWEISPDDDLHEDPDSSSGGLDDAQRHHEEVQDALHDDVVRAETEVADHDGLPVRHRVIGTEHF